MRAAEKQRRIATAHQEDIAWFIANPKQTVHVRVYVKGEFIDHSDAYSETMVVKTPDGGIFRRPVSTSTTKFLFNLTTRAVDAVWFVEPSTVNSENYLLTDK